MELYCYVKVATLRKHIVVVGHCRTPESPLQSLYKGCIGTTSYMGWSTSAEALALRATTAMRALPLGVPKLCITTIQNTAPYMGKRWNDSPSHVDLAGDPNGVEKNVLTNAAKAIVGIGRRLSQAFFIVRVTVKEDILDRSLLSALENRWTIELLIEIENQAQSLSTITNSERNCKWRRETFTPQAQTQPADTHIGWSL